MKKNRREKLFQILFIWMIIIACITGYLNVESKEKNKILTENISQETALAYSNQQHNKNLVSPSENYIVIAGITKDLLHDPQGEHIYLNHNKEGIYDGIGVPYMDYRHDLTGRKTIIYAHSMKAGNGPFQILQNQHNNPSFYQKHRYITIYYENNTYIYEIFSVYVSVADNEESEGLEFFHRNNYSEKEWSEVLQQYKENSEYDTGVNVNSTDHIIILQTCSMDDQYFEKYYRYNLLIMGRQLS